MAHFSSGETETEIWPMGTNVLDKFMDTWPQNKEPENTLGSSSDQEKSFISL